MIHTAYDGDSVFSTSFSQGIGGVKFREEFPTTSKLLCSTYSQIKGDCSLKALKFKLLIYTGENTGIWFVVMTIILTCTWLRSTWKTWSGCCTTWSDCLLDMLGHEVWIETSYPLFHRLEGTGIHMKDHSQSCRVRTVLKYPTKFEWVAWVDTAKAGLVYYNN